MNDLDYPLILKVVSFERELTNGFRFTLSSEFFNPFVYVVVVVVCTECFFLNHLTASVVDIGCGSFEYVRSVRVPNHEANWEVAFHVIKRVGRNDKKSTELRSEEVSEIRKVRSLQNFQS